jgi:hypothetical protein
MEASHLKEQEAEAARQMSELMQPILAKDLPLTANRDKILEALKEKLVASFNSEDLTNKIVAVYAKYFSDDDITAMTRFYESPAGQHSLEAMPKMFADLAHIGQKFAIENLPLIKAQLCEEFPELRGEAKFCPAGPKPHPPRYFSVGAGLRPARAAALLGFHLL